MQAPFHAFLAIILSVLLLLPGLTSAAIVQMFEDNFCKIPTRTPEINVWDNSCSTSVGGFSSWKIVYPGARRQFVTMFGPNACIGKWTSCEDASSVGVCRTAVNKDGASNALSSTTKCGTA